MKLSSLKYSIPCIFFLCFSLIFFTGCSHSSQNNTGSKDKFDNFLTSCFKEYVSSDTVTTHFKLAHPEVFGLSDQKDPCYEDFSPEQLKENCRKAETFLTQLKTFNTNELSEENQFTRKVFRDFLEKQIAAEEYILYASPLGTNGLQSQIPVTLSEYSFDDEKDVRAYLSLINQIPDYFTQIIQFEEARRKADIISPDFVINNTITQINQWLNCSEKENLLAETFEDKIQKVPNLSDEQKNSYIKNNRALISQVVLPAFSQLKEQLKRFSSSNGLDKTSRDGICQYEKGQEYYQFLLAAGVGTSLSSEKCILILENQLKDTVAHLGSLTKENPDLYTEYLSAQPALTDTRTILSSLKEDTFIDFPKPPEVPYTLKEVPDALSSTSASAFYLLPPIDGPQKNIIYINPERVDSSEQFSTLAHEGFPGHLYQNNYYLTTDPEPIRSLTRCNGYDEGWGTYAQLYSYQYMDFQDTDAETTRLLRELYRDNDILSLTLSSLSDLYVNTRSYNLEDLEQFLASYGVPAENARNIYTYVVENPANYLSYSIGWYELMQLRQTMEKRLGDSFDIHEFHQAVLDAGSCPFSLLSRQVRKSMTSQ